MSTWPSILSTLTDPAPTDKLNSPSHSSIESAQNDGIEKLESFVGTLSSTAGTLIYDIRATASDGGGHVQAANKGGTGQTTYTKGDILVAQSSSVLSKLAVGTDNYSLVADSTQNVGVKWAQVTNKITVVASTFSLNNPDGVGQSNEGSVMSVTIPGGTLSTNNAVRATAYVDNFLSGSRFTLKVHWGGASVATFSSVLGGDGSIGALAAHKGVIEIMLMANGSANVQLINSTLRFRQDSSIAGGAAVQGASDFKTSTANVSSASDATLGITGFWNASNADNRFSRNAVVVEKIS